MRRVGAALALTALSCSAPQPPSTPAPPAERVVFCAATVTHHDQPRCVRELGAAEQKQRAISYRLTLRGGRVVELAAVDGRGALVENEDTWCAASSYAYSGERLAGELCRDRNGTPRARVRYDGTRALWLDAWGRPRHRGDGEASGLDRTFAADGRVIEYRYLDADGKAVKNERGVYRVRPRRNAAGELIESSYWDELGNPTSANEGMHRVEITPDGFGGFAAERFFGIGGKPVLHEDGYHQARYQNDAVGNRVGGAFFGIDGRPVRYKQKYHSAYRYLRNRQGDLIEVHYLDASGRPAQSEYGYAIQKRTLDRNGLVVDYAHFDGQGRPIARKEGHHRLHLDRDPDGRVITETSLDVRGRPVKTEEGYAIARIQRDARGLQVRRAHYGADGEPVVSKHAYHAVAFDRDPFDQITEYRWFGADGKPLAGSAGFARLVLRRNRDGKVTAREHYGADGKRVTLGKYTLLSIAFRTDDAPDETRTQAEAEQLAAEVRALLDAGKTLEQAAEQLGLKLHSAQVATRSLLEGFRALEPGQTSGVVIGRAAVMIARRDE